MSDPDFWPRAESYGASNPAPGTSLWRYLNHPDTMQDEDWHRLAAAYVTLLDAELGDWTRLAVAWANVMDGRRIGEGLTAARIGRETTTGNDWHEVAAEYARLRESGDG